MKSNGYHCFALSEGTNTEIYSYYKRGKCEAIAKRKEYCCTRYQICVVMSFWCFIYFVQRKAASIRGHYRRYQPNNNRKHRNTNRPTRRRTHRIPASYNQNQQQWECCNHCWNYKSGNHGKQVCHLAAFRQWLGSWVDVDNIYPFLTHNFIHNPVATVEQLAHGGIAIFGHDTTQANEVYQRVGALDKPLNQLFSVFRRKLLGVIPNFGQFFQRRACPPYLNHVFTICFTSSWEYV